MSVAVNPPKTPITKGSMGIAAATVPNICKMPGPPAPFVPAPLPNIGKSGDRPKKYSKKVKIEKKTVAIKGASFGSMGDIASKGTGGGIVSSNTHGPTKFISPGSMDVKIEGKNVQLLGDMMTNNNGPSGSPANSATLCGTLQKPKYGRGKEGEKCIICDKSYENHPFVQHTDLKPTSIHVNNLIKALNVAYKNRERVKKPVTKTTEHGGYMIGVMMCIDHPDVFATMSGINLPGFKDVVDELGFVLVGPVKGEQEEGTPVRQRDFFPKNSRLAKRNKWRFKDKWSDAEEQHHEKGCPEPGVCAAQKLLSHKGHQAVAMTEAWFSPKKVKQKRKAVIIGGKAYQHKEIVPSCETCEVLLPFLLCDMKDTC